MSLEKYQKKRKFSKTPEPKGQVQKNTGPLTFVVQKHHASQLHYDFRLELDGVLKSWAVPRGPSTDPEEKRLAMMVEDHPMEYASFEGIIPKGNYGAGTVMVWDQGVYTPYDSTERKESEKILLEQLKKGHLTFVMLGEKLKGEFALIKTPNAGENAWLLIKKGDEYAGKIDILGQDSSVLTNRSMDQIKNQSVKKNDIWYSKPHSLDLSKAPKSNMPHSVKPMLAESSDKPFDDSDWLFEMKWDGYRAIAEIAPGDIRLYSRNNQPYIDKFAPIAQALTKFPGSAVLDGEVVVLDSSGHPIFNLLQDYPKSKGELVYYVFDILHYEGHDLTKLPLIQRKEILKTILPPLPGIVFSEYIEDTGTLFFNEVEKLGLEGIIAKKKDSNYQIGTRSKNWLKIKGQLRQEAIIAGFTAPKGGRRGFGALVLGIQEQGSLKYIGHTGGGFDDKSLDLILKKLTPLIQKDCPFPQTPPTNAPVTWVKPKLICEVTFSSWTEDQKMRHPIFIGLREDKNSKEVIKENYFSKDAPGQKETMEVQIGKRTLNLVNLNKIFWPKEKYTKGDLINYYREVAPAILPHLRNRPQSLLRFPHGIEGESFFQKDVGNLNLDWMTRTHFKHEGKTIEYMLIQDEASLIYAINLGCIDLNPWNSTISKPDNPTYLIIDLDPEDISFDKVVETALEVRKLLEQLEIESFPKTSGSKGMHIYVPLGEKYDYEQTRYFAQLLCNQVLTRIPRITSMIRNPKDRQGKVYLDFLQNARGQTLASVYSVRAKPEAPVSTPLKWSEVTKKLHPTQFTIKNIPQRLQKEGDLFKGVLGKGVNIPKVLKKLAALL